MSVEDQRVIELRKLLPKAMTSDWVRAGSRLVRLLRDRLHPSRHEAILERLLRHVRASVELRQDRAARVPAVSYPAELPISFRREEIVQAIRAHPVVIVAGETGSGKTTQIPKMCLEAGLGIEGKIGCTQPRRVAALSISRRLAEELNVDWGQQVGCKIRFDDRSSALTYIKFMTDGILLAEIQGDPLLTEYNALIIDEAHERSLNIDFLLGYLKGLLARRPELKLVITSATINTEAFSKAFGNAPVIEVSGRVYPVEVMYRPLGAGEESPDMSYTDAAVAAVGAVLAEPGGGDVLVFLPGEKDIREVSDALKLAARREEIIPLYGRLGSGDQQRVFAPAQHRKVVVATNIAETSLTIPGIKYVVDSGLARISRYNPRTRTRRLPIEPISRSSANQRKGRCGRVRHGVCIRLYSEEDFLARPEYTQPEIQRANLAEVILRMKAFRLGEIESFPFLNPPAPAAISGGYTLLQELGALDETRELTQLGRDLARLPIDPTLGRMLLQSQKEHATRELLIIASGLSVQDPRERPIDKKDAAAAAHKRFSHPESDFLTLLNIWNAVHEQWEKLATQSQRRKFCRENFLSHQRMREWQDLHDQLEDALGELGNLKLNESNAACNAVHRSILAGLLGHVAVRTERNVYKGIGNRLLCVFPGSALYERSERTPTDGEGDARPWPGRKPLKSTQPEWIVAGEVVETSQVFARTLAGIDPLWIAELGSHLCRVTHENPRWDAHAGQVLATERVFFHGLEVRSRPVAFGNVNPLEATKIFVRSALVEERLFPELPGPEETAAAHGRGRGRRDRSWKRDPAVLRATMHEIPRVAPGAPASVRYPFLEHNRKVRQKIETWQTRMRRHDLPDLDDALEAFYLARISNVSSIHELDRFLRGLPSQDVLHVTEQDLVGGVDLRYDELAFPDSVQVQGEEVRLAYAYAPGDEQDGVTLRMSSALARHASPAQVQWAVPGLRESQAAELLRGLPKSLRRELMPLQPKAEEIARELKPSAKSLAQDLSDFVRRVYGVQVPPASWPLKDIAPHLRPRIEILDSRRETIAAGRDLAALQAQLGTAPVKKTGVPDAWKQAASKWERYALTQWNIGDPPERVEIGEDPKFEVRSSKSEVKAPSSDEKPQERTQTGMPPGREVREPARRTFPEASASAWLGLQLEDGQVNLRLFGSSAAAASATPAGFQRLLELALQKDLAWLHKDLRVLSRFDPLLAGWVSFDQIQADAFEHLKSHILTLSCAKQLWPLKEVVFLQSVEAARKGLPGLAAELSNRLEPILKLRLELSRRAHPAMPTPRLVRAFSPAEFQKHPATAPGPKPRHLLILEAERGALLPPHFLARISFDRLKELPRYLKALMLRVERAAHNPAKDLERSRVVAPYASAAGELLGKTAADPEARKLAEEFRWMVEEFKVSIFAQELGTAFPVSTQRLDEFLLAVRARI